MSKTINIPGREPLDKTSFKYSGVNYSGVCRAAKSLMLEFLKTCFENLPKSHQFRFDEEQNHSKINIVDKLTFNLNEVDKRPAIVVHRGSVGFSKQGRDSTIKHGRLQRRQDDSGEYEGSTHKTGLLRGALSVRCYGKGQTLQAELLGESVFELITDMEDALREIGFFECYANGIGEEVKVSEGGKVTYIMVPINVVFSMQRSWSITPTNLRIMRDAVIKNLQVINQD